MMQILINNQPTDMPEGASIAQVLAQLQPRPPFAVAVNTQFVPKGRYEQQLLQADNKVEVIAPVTGG